MNFFICAFVSAGLIAQQPESAKPTAERKPSAEAKPAPPAETKPELEQSFQMEFEFGTRWNQGVAGNLDTYRSVVNLGEGPRLFDWNIRFNPQNVKYFKKAEFRGAGWGGDPAAWLQLRVEEPRYYRLTGDYRRTAYFNAMPSFANPFVERGILVNQRSFDTNRHFTEFQLDLFPSAAVIPYFAYTRDRGYGRGTTSFVSDANEYPVLNELSDRTNMFRGGLRMETPRYHALIEQGGILFRDNQRLLNGDRNSGNNGRPFLGQTLFLQDLIQLYEINGSSLFTRGAASAQPASWADISGSFQFSQPRNDITSTQSNTGLFVDLDSLLFFNSQTSRILGSAKQPHLTANLGLDLNIGSRVRVLQSWMTDRLHNASSSQALPMQDRLEWSYSQQQTEALVDPARFLTLRGGYRYSWGDGTGRSGLLGIAPLETGQLRRHSALAGATLRAGHPFSIHYDVEIARSDRVIFRTSVTDYERMRLRARYQLRPSLLLYAGFHYLNNENPPKFNRFELRQQSQAFGFQWSPAKKTIQLLSEYARSSMRSNLDYFAPQILSRQQSLYRENAHTVTAMANILLPATWTWQPKLSLGGSAFRSSGSRPTTFHQPVIRFTIPIWRHVDLFSEYRWYGVSQNFHVYEGFRSHQGAVGLRFY